MAAYSALFPARGKLPTLTELSLGTLDEPPTTDPILDTFELAPKLRSLQCVNLHPYMFKLPWSNLSEIPIMTVTIDDALDILRRAPHLETASFIYTEEFCNLPIPSPTPFKHEKLKDLALLASEDHEVIETHILFRNLTAPQLRSLRICNIEWPFHSHLSIFLARVVAIESLYLRNTAITEAELLSILELIPTLKHLTLLSSSTHTMVSDLFLSRLTWRSTSKTILLPKLETLEISLPGPLTATFADLLESRWEVNEDTSPVAQLLCVDVRASDEYDDGIMLRLELLAQAGMKIVIGSTDVSLKRGLEYFSSQ
ncbi:hypothetical protein H0H93_010484 [Arthromyces matolae]|nr:hypothetical protein H0H93_010484 [Arthromyces matolae]